MLGLFTLALIYILLFFALIWIWIDIIRLFISKEFRQSPPFVPSFGQQKKQIIERVERQLNASTTPMNILDPGCGSGTLLIELARKFPNHKFTGIEWTSLTAAVASFRTRKLANVEIIRGNMFDYSFEKYQIIICFLMQPLMERFGNKLKQDCHPGTMIYSNTFYIPNLDLSEKIEIKGFYRFNDLYIYKI